MTFELSIPYIKGPSLDLNDNMNDYYKTSEDYVNALVNEENSTGYMVYNNMAGRKNNVNTYYAMPNENYYKIEKDESVDYANAKCILMTPDGMYDEDVDSIIDKFASQKEFLVMAHFNLSDMDGEFEEEISGWAKETINILKYSNELFQKNGSREIADKFIDVNIPRRDMKLSFLNKSGKRVDFILSRCEIERKIAKNRYLFYVKKMNILK